MSLVCRRTAEHSSITHYSPYWIVSRKRQRLQVHYCGTENRTKIYISSYTQWAETDLAANCENQANLISSGQNKLEWWVKTSTYLEQIVQFLNKAIYKMSIGQERENKFFDCLGERTFCHGEPRPVEGIWIRKYAGALRTWSIFNFAAYLTNQETDQRKILWYFNDSRLAKDKKRTLVHCYPL